MKFSLPLSVAFSKGSNFILASPVRGGVLRYIRGARAFLGLEISDLAFFVRLISGGKILVGFSLLLLKSVRSSGSQFHVKQLNQFHFKKEKLKHKLAQNLLAFLCRSKGLFRVTFCAVGVLGQ